MRGFEGSMRKRAKFEADMHINSNIIISMDEKARHRSQYMKKHGLQRSDIIEQTQKMAAGVQNYLVNSSPGSQNPHINQSRRRILNDYTKSPEQSRATSLEQLANRNLSD